MKTMQLHILEVLTYAYVCLGLIVLAWIVYQFKPDLCVLMRRLRLFSSRLREALNSRGLEEAAQDYTLRESPDRFVSESNELEARYRPFISKFHEHEAFLRVQRTALRQLAVSQAYFVLVVATILAGILSAFGSVVLGQAEVGILLISLVLLLAGVFASRLAASTKITHDAILREVDRAVYDEVELAKAA